MTTIITRTVTRTVVPLIFVTSVALMLQGHNLPGGGFIAGVLTTTAFALVYIVYGLGYLEEELFHRMVRGPVEHLQHGIVENYRALFALGLALAAGSGLVSMAFDHAFLYQTHDYVRHLPIYGELHVASALAFDTGVYLVVVGALLTILSVVGAE
ncbi:MnhB domain-containing protein [Haladaptatus salinisoli]|uniref:MnhB domain-containing protein n=1 Tax=Haladaptatus salinisoli TaxID=2884876 RepID=UPI001D0BA5DD|nr:MnhB domain-containing protein [Haladaptatus salinisoli]